MRRNHAKRLIKESYRLNENEIEGGYSIVFLLKKDCDICLISFKDVYMDVKKILNEMVK